MRLPAKLEKLREDAGRSCRAIADLMAALGIEVSESKVRRWEAGKNVPNIREAAALAHIYCVSVAFLADDALDEPPPALSPIEAEILRLSRKMGLEAAMDRLSLVPQGEQAAPAPPSEPRFVDEAAILDATVPDRAGSVEPEHGGRAG